MSGHKGDDTRKERLAAQLRANLRRRKEQSRKRGSADAADATASPDDAAHKADEPSSR